MPKSAAPKWTFARRFRRHAFRWRSQPACGSTGQGGRLRDPEGGKRGPRPRGQCPVQSHLSISYGRPRKRGGSITNNVGRSRRRHGAGVICAKGSLSRWSSVPTACEGTSRQTGYRATEIPDGRFRSRLFLARPSMPPRQAPRNEPAILEREARQQHRARPANSRPAARLGLAHDRDLAMRPRTGH